MGICAKIFANQNYKQWAGMFDKVLSKFPKFNIFATLAGR